MNYVDIPVTVQAKTFDEKNYDEIQFFIFKKQLYSGKVFLFELYRYCNDRTRERRLKKNYDKICFFIFFNKFFWGKFFSL